ncbi:2TM domain-containing protein [Flavobacterium sp. GT3R68]|uniref:2TM domain-containing protein n=1 Tax=Flavobacterium sp. GT3R68 TaxID=2594437 RepID=UPI000F88198C|nr:2TM domain-containing protein [Flavobacterium sp. GT3R68]RTY92400.1 2TM domain-containing protein [Flavobacterium sp. GSN2]TRW92316.1 2TM domain-containing protein [Flavobacterium sp. GT3R68]
MRNRQSWDFDKYQYQPENAYEAAERKVKRLKGFYTHLVIYLCVNIIIVFINFDDLAPGESYFKMENFYTAFFWGIGLLINGLSVFGNLYFFGRDWEERKMKEFMEKETIEKDSWK